MTFSFTKVSIKQTEAVEVILLYTFMQGLVVASSKLYCTHFTFNFH